METITSFYELSRETSAARQARVKGDCDTQKAMKTVYFVHKDSHTQIKGVSCTKKNETKKYVCP